MRLLQVFWEMLHPLSKIIFSALGEMIELAVTV